jgi:hypothetical protein
VGLPLVAAPAPQPVQVEVLESVAHGPQPTEGPHPDAVLLAVPGR